MRVFFMSETFMRNNVKLASGRRGWRGRLHEVYSSREEWLGYAELYNLAERLGYDGSDAAWADKVWDENPMLEGSTNPEDFKIVK